MMTRSLKRFCNLEIKKLDDNNLVNDQRNTVESYVKRKANQKNRISGLGQLDNKLDLPQTYLDQVKSGTITIL